MEESPRFKRKKKLGSYPYISVVLSTTLALYVIGVFGLLVIYSRELERVVRENVKIQVYLKGQLNESQRLQIEKNIAARSFVSKKAEKSIVFISKDDAAKQFIKETGEDFQKFLGENPLKDAFVVVVDPAYQDAASLTKVKGELEQINGVFQVNYVENLIESINKNVTQIGLVLLGLAGLLFLTVVLLINNTLRLALFSQRFLIRSMQLVGATRNFIQQPFLWRASLQGLISGMIASALLVSLISFANNKIEDLRLIQNNDRIVLLIVSLVLLGILVAVAATYRAVRKYLRLSLDELY